MYRVERVDFTDSIMMDKLVELQNAVYQGKHTFTSDNFKFWYLDNPEGRVVSFNAFDGDKMIAHYACIPTRMKIGERLVKGIHSMATVTHPDYRGKGLFKMLAQKTYDYARKQGYEFVIGVANANSFPGFMKYLNFTFVSRLEVKFGWGRINVTEKMYSKFWDKESLDWRLSNPKYSIKRNYVFGKYRNYPIIKTMMGYFPSSILSALDIRKSKNILRPFNLYIGIGADLSKGCYFNFPKFIKHSPFNLIFLDLTDGALPPLDKNNIFFQLVDFDVA